MFSFLLIATTFVTAGYAFAALLMTIGYFSFTEKGHIVSLARLSTIMLAFYSLCYLILRLVALWKMLTKNYPVSNGSVWVHFSPLFFVGILTLLISVATLVIPFCKKHPVLILLPMSIIINLDNIIYPFIPHTDTAAFTKSLVDNQPATLLLFGVLYCLVLFLLYLVELWIKRIMAEE